MQWGAAVHTLSTKRDQTHRLGDESGEVLSVVGNNVLTKLEVNSTSLVASMPKKCGQDNDK